MSKPGATLEVRLNESALQEAGFDLDTGSRQVHHVLTEAGFQVQAPRAVAAQDLKRTPTTWAKRLAYGRSPRAVYLSGRP